ERRNRPADQRLAVDSARGARLQGHAVGRSRRPAREHVVEPRGAYLGRGGVAQRHRGAAGAHSRKAGEPHQPGGRAAAGRQRRAQPAPEQGAGHRAIRRARPAGAGRPQAPPQDARSPRGQGGASAGQEAALRDQAQPRLHPPRRM
ncbi:MAG: Hypothetical protein YaeJ with similarity to translation release factor, partial [uncultured Gemmatimonadetes bacterium]